ncbi:MAG: AarF/ABC1/UbiB kinase family protein [Actinobacteria bacterium]|nr:AarF/ABC1/UbiB kinase family protein [Actinomycetota bacterium]MBU1609979.1 AarF/ABC1/UbiB kinase family protein [Actinomycetota bacterium]MBU2315653.1 AarF/ABC1/UbiB kinase family protein [Actinomycetota bacterium]MBU2385507.1 AarF/ABC1/UbiB kinase family protein [Actinomycetota bacterium]
MRFAARALAQAWWFELVLPRFGLARFAARGRIRRLQKLARRFHALAADLGGLMIKVGQFLSSRLDVLPPEITRELEGLQDEVAPELFASIVAQAERELGIPLDRAYAHFESEPIAAASLGQAHRARLTPALAADMGFENVVVKVLRPGIEQIVEVDLAALRRVARWLSRVKLVNRRADAPALIEEFATTSLEEIDYVHEAGNAERFAEIFADDPRVGAPVIVWERSARRVLTLADVTAIKITDVGALQAAGLDPDAVAAELARATFEQIFVAGFFHADPHPGNIFVTPSAEHGFTITYIDFGMMGEITDELRDGLQQFIFAVASRDARGWVVATQRLGVLLPSADTVELERAVTALFDRFGGMGVAELTALDPRELQQFALQFSELVRTLPFQLPESFLLLIRTVSLISGVTSALNRDFNMWDAVDPFARTLLRGGGTSTARSLGREAVAILSALARLPQRVDALATRLDRGELAVRSPEVEQRLRVLDGSVRRATSAILFAALLLAGVILRPTDEALSWVLIGASALPLLHAVAPWRLR